MPTGLYARIGLPLLVLMLAVSVAIALLLRAQLRAQARERLADLARADAAFVEQASLPVSEKLARDLQRVGGFDVHFRVSGALVPAAASPSLADELMRLPSDGEVRDVASGFEACARPLPRGDLVLVRRVSETLSDPRIVWAVGSSWAIALLLAVLVLRGVVRPLRNVAAQLPRIDGEEPLELPEAMRSDEIGDVARALVDTREGLQRERERREAAEKLAVLGRMTASLAHQVQNPVAAIQMHAQLWRASAEDVGPVDVIASEASRIERMLNQWMYLTRPEPPVRAMADVGELLDAVLRANEARFAHAEVSVEREVERPLQLDCDRSRMEQVFDNLVVNAVQAMPEGGELRIRATGAADEVVLEFLDSGGGFSEQALRRVGEFFFSEKEGGMGIGLAVAQEVVQAHGGRLSVDNTDTGGRVTIRLPRDGQKVVK